MSLAKITSVALILLTCPAAAEALARRAPLRNPVLLNIGFICQWQRPCIDRQEHAMNSALGYVRRTDPPTWKIELCNRNASRRYNRVDWVGFENCITNRRVRKPARVRRR
jgi:hypothetical protein